VLASVTPSGFALLIGSELTLLVAPAARGAGVGRSLLDAALSSAPRPVVAWSHGGHPAAAALAGSHGFVAARSLLKMSRRSTDDVPAAVVSPGITVRAMVASDLPALLEVNAAAFAHHPEQGSMSASDFAERVDEPWFSYSDVLLAFDGSALLGFHWMKLTPPIGEVYVIGVSPVAQGRGLGRSLMLLGLVHLVKAGAKEIELFVESDNSPAVALYESLGFTVTETHTQYRRD
jgi:mycothiol synthase